MQSDKTPQTDEAARHLPAPYAAEPPAAYPPYAARRAAGPDPRLVISLALALLGVVLFAAWYFLVRPDDEQQARNGGASSLASGKDTPLPPPPTRAVQMTPEEQATRWREIRDEYHGYLRDRVQLARLLSMTEDRMIPTHRKPPFTFDLNVPPLPPGMDSREVQESGEYRSQREDPTVRQSVAVYLERLGQRSARLVLLGDSLGPGEASTAFRRLHELGRAERQAIEVWMREGSDVAHRALVKAQDAVMHPLPDIDRMVKKSAPGEEKPAPDATGAAIIKP